MKSAWLQSALQYVSFEKKAVLSLSFNQHTPDFRYREDRRCYVHSVDHEVPYASLEWDVGSVGRLLYFCRNTTEEDALQAHRLVVGERCLPLGLLVHLNCKRSDGTQRQKNTKYYIYFCRVKVFNRDKKHTQTLTCQAASLCAASALSHHSVRLARLV